MSINGFSYKKNGWQYVSIWGEPFERGYAYGKLCANEFKEIQKMLDFFVLESFGVDWKEIVKKVSKDITANAKKRYMEFYKEIEGIAKGCNDNGCSTTTDEILAWNYYCSIPYWFGSRYGDGGAKEGGGIYKGDRCSAFIAVGDEWTSDGKIVVAHNSFADFIDGQWANVILCINPTKGTKVLLQSCPLWIWSGADFFVTGYGMVGTETTLGGFNKFALKDPICFRIRKAMQYGKNLDDYVDMLVDNNSGDYANSWLIGDTNTNEIMRLELGLKYYDVKRTKNGYFIGFNAPYSPKIRNLESDTTGFYDIRRHQGARNVRLTQLMKQYKGNLNIKTAKQIISDHYDVYLSKKNHPCSRTVCSHYYLDKREYMSQPGRPVPYALHGAVDGLVADHNGIRKMEMEGRYGNSCGMNFNADDFFRKHIQWEPFKPYVKSRPSQPWTKWSANEKNMKQTKQTKQTKKNKNKNKINKRNKTKKTK